MPQIDFNPNVNANQAVQQANLANVLENLEGKTPLSSILSGSSLTISDAATDLEALAAKLGVETSSVKETSLKNALSTISDALKAAKERNDETWQTISGYTDELNTLVDKAVLDNEGNPAIDPNTGIPVVKKGAISTTQDEIDALDTEISTLNNEISTLNNTINGQETQLTNLNTQLNARNTELSNLNDQLDNLNTQLKNATDDKTKANLTAQINEVTNQITNKTNQITTLTNQIDTLTVQFNNNKTTLGEKQAALSTAETARSEKQTTLDNLIARKIELDTAIASEVKKLVDDQKVANTTKTQRDEIVSSTHVNDDKKAERSDEEEKYLDTHSTVRIIQDAINRHDTDMLDTIDGKRETKV